MTPATTSPTVALFTAAAAAAAGIAYWSSASNTTTFGTLVLEILRVTGTLEGNGKSDKKSSSNNNDNDNNSNTEEKNNGDDWNKAFVSWLDREETENDVPGRTSRNNSGMGKDDDLADPYWMSETIRNALLSTAMAAVSGLVSETATARSVRKEGSSTVSSSSSVDTETIQETMLSPISQLMDDEQETLCERAFRRSFRTLQKATEAMIRNEPAIREDFFNGVSVDGENDPKEDEKKQERLRSLSISSSSSSWSAMSSSTGSYEVNKDNFLIEEEEEVERFLTYLRFVELAKEETSSSSSSLSSSKDYLGRTTGCLQRRRERIVPDADGYELLSSTTMEIQDVTDTQRAKVGHTAAVHRYRKELVIAVHYDGSSFSSSTDDDQNRIKNILMSSLFLQQQAHSAISRVDAPSSSFLLLDQAVESLSEEILLRYLHKSSSFLSSGYRLVLCGHSLGAALACRLGDTLRHRHRDNGSLGIEVRVCAFGPPPCLPSRQKSNQDGDDPGEDYPYITSVVNNHDCVPRWTESNLIGLRMSLRFLTDRKKRHFQRYHNRYNRSHPSTNPATAATIAVVKLPPRRIPPFSLSSRDWNTFWKSNQEPNAFLPQENADDAGTKYIVPGKVVSIWNHSQDPTIIGAKVHILGTNCCYPTSSSDCHHLSQHHHPHRLSHKNHDILGRLWVDEGMFSDHRIESYRSNLELLLGQVANTI